MARSLRTAAPHSDVVLPPLPGADAASSVGVRGLGSEGEASRFGHTARAGAQRTPGSGAGRAIAATDGTATVAIGGGAVAVETAAADQGGGLGPLGGGAWIENVGTGRFHPWKGRRAEAKPARGSRDGAGQGDDLDLEGTVGRDFSAWLLQSLDAVASLAAGLLAGISLTILLVSGTLGTAVALVAALAAASASLRVLVSLLTALLWVTAAVPLMRARRFLALPQVLLAPLPAASGTLAASVMRASLRGGGAGVPDDDTDLLAVREEALPPDDTGTGAATGPGARDVLAALAALVSSAAAGGAGGSARARSGRSGAAGDQGGALGAMVEAAGHLHEGADLRRVHRGAAATLLRRAAAGRAAPEAVDAALADSAPLPSKPGRGDSHRQGRGARRCCGCCGGPSRVVSAGGAAAGPTSAGQAPQGLCSCAALPVAAAAGGRGCCTNGGGCCGCVSTRGLRWSVLLGATTALVAFWLSAPAETLLTAAAVRGSNTTGLAGRLSDWRVLVALRAVGAMWAWIFLTALLQRQRAALRGARAVSWSEAASRVSAEAALAISSGDATCVGALSTRDGEMVAAAQLASAERSRGVVDRVGQ